MLRVTIDLLPFGDKDKKKTISTFDIGNDGTGTNVVGNYVHRFHGNLKWEPSVQGHNRYEPVESLVVKVLEKYLNGLKSTVHAN